MKETALITGASSGIGLDLARLFARDGHDVILVARSEGKLREVAADLERDFGVKAHVIVADLARPDAPRQLVDALPVDVDVLVNNAGFGVTAIRRDRPGQRAGDDPGERRCPDAPDEAS